MKTKMPSPSKSQGAHTPRRKSRRTLSVGSPALSTASGRLTSVVQDFVNKQMNSFALSPLPRRRSVLTDNTDIMEEPRRKSWWKNLNENSRNVLEILDDNNLAGPEPNNIMEELDVEILSQEKRNYTLDIPESSDGESIHSIILPQRKLFNQKESHPQKNFGQIIGTRESMTKSKNMTINDKVTNAGTKKLFQTKPRSKLLFPPALIDISPDKTIADKTNEFATIPETQPRNIFGNRQGAKRKNMFADFIATESEDEIPDIQPRIFGFSKKPETLRRGSSASRGLRESSPTSNATTDTEMDEWRMLPSSTMVEHQLEAMMEQNTPKRLRLSKLTEASGTSTVFSKTTSPKPNTSVLTRSRLRALNNSGTGTVGGKDKTQEKPERNQSKKNNQHDQSQNNIKVNITSEQNEDQDLRITNINQEKLNKSKRKNNNSLQKTNVSLKVTDKINKSQEILGNKQDKNESKEEVDGNRKINVALEANQSQDQTDKKQEQNEVNVNLENSKQKVIAKSQEIEESEEFIESKSIDKNKKVEKTLQEEENQEGESENEENESQEVAGDSDNEEVDKTQDQINESQEQEEQANESQTHFNESMEQEDEDQAADQSQVEVDENNDAINQSQVDENDEENDEEIDQTADEVNESNEAADESNVIADESQEEVNESKQGADVSSEAVNHIPELVNESNEVQNESQLALEDDENEANELAKNTQDEEENEAVEDEHEVQNESQLAVEDDENEAIEDDKNPQEEIDESDAEDDEAVDNKNPQEEVYESDVEDEAVDNENPQEEVDESDEEENEAIEDDENTQEEVDESDEEENEAVEDDENTQEEVDKSNIEENEAVEDNENTQGEVGKSNLEENEAVGEEDESAELHYESASEEMEVDDEPQNDEDVTPINQENDTNTPEPVDNEYNISHDTTGRNRNKHQSPEAILHDKTKQSDSFSAHRNTSIRKTKSVVNLLNGKPSLIPARDSVGFSDGTTNSSAEGSGWDSHRTTRKTIRQTFGRDATPRKSLRALVMEKSAKRHTLASETAKFPLANSTAVPEISFGYLDIQPVHQESTHEVSLRTRQLTLDAVLEKIKEDNLKKRAKIEESVKKALETRSADHIFKIPRQPMFPRRQTNKENKPSKVKPIWHGLPKEMIKDLQQYKPPKRFKPNNTPWITKRLYKYLEDKLEPKYNYKARVRAEKLVETLYNFTKELRRRSAATEDATNELKHEMARLHIVATHHQFYEFFRQFMPKEIMIKVIPDVVNKIPLPRCDVFSNIITLDSAQG